jgi:hypothetical protein
MDMSTQTNIHIIPYILPTIGVEKTAEDHPSLLNLVILIIGFRYLLHGVDLISYCKLDTEAPRLYDIHGLQETLAQVWANIMKAESRYYRR